MIQIVGKRKDNKKLIYFKKDNVIYIHLSIPQKDDYKFDWGLNCNFTHGLNLAWEVLFTCFNGDIKFTDDNHQYLYNVFIKSLPIQEFSFTDEDIQKIVPALDTSRWY